MDKSIGSYSFLRNLIGGILILFSMQTIVHAQQVVSSKVTSIQLLDNYLNNSKGSDQLRLNDLVYEVQSSVYFENNEAKTYGASPINLYTDINGFLQLPKANFEKATIELITIRIDNSSQITNTLNLASLTGFPKLKYVYILATFPYTLQQISKVVTSSGSDYIVVFKSDMGS